MPGAVVLLSGGLDSATCLAWALRERFEVHALTVAYGQRHGIEVDRARAIARACEVPSHRVVEVDLTFLSGSALTDATVAVPKSANRSSPAGPVPVTYVPARNTVFLALATAWAESLGARDVVIGVNAVDFSGYPDCRPAFLAAFEAVAREGTRIGAEGSRWRIHAPLADLSKAEIVRRAVAWRVPLVHTLSCYDPDASGTPCGSCDACHLRIRGFQDAGIEDPALRR